MKLYAKTTSNRASSGQGGDYLDIEITNESREVMAEISIKDRDIVIWYDADIADVVSYNDRGSGGKGKKQKGE